MTYMHTHSATYRHIDVIDLHLPELLCSPIDILARQREIVSLGCYGTDLDWTIWLHSSLKAYIHTWFNIGAPPSTKVLYGTAMQSIIERDGCISWMAWNRLRWTLSLHSYFITCMQAYHRHLKHIDWLMAPTVYVVKVSYISGCLKKHLKNKR